MMESLFPLAVVLMAALAGCDDHSRTSMKQNRFIYGHPVANVTHVMATLGRKAVMKCSVDNMNTEKLIVSWVRYRDTSLLAVGKFVYISDDRFKVLHEPGSRDWHLAIRSAGYPDEGIYECQINSGKGFQSVKKKYLLSVVEPRTVIEGERELFVDHASSLNLTCVVISPEPPAYVFWKKDDQFLDVSSTRPGSSSSLSSAPSSLSSSSSGVRIVFEVMSSKGVTVSSLIIPTVNRSHNGLFSCNPSNSESKSIRVHVLKDDSHPAAIHTTSSAGWKSRFEMGRQLTIIAVQMLLMSLLPQNIY